MRGFEDLPIDWAPAALWCNSHGMQQSVRFIAPGVPQPKGSLIKGRWGGYHSAAKGLDDWVKTVHDQAQAAMNGDWRRRTAVAQAEALRNRAVGTAAPAKMPRALELFNGSVSIDIQFVLPRPKTFTPPIWLKDDRPLWKAMFIDGTPPHLKRLDVDKCIRAVGDALTGVVWHDDSQVVDARGRKRYAYPDESTGAIISVTSDVRVT